MRRLRSCRILCTPLPRKARIKVTPMDKEFKIGDRVIWNSEARYVSGTIIKVYSRGVDYKGYLHHASRDYPQYGSGAARLATLQCTRALH
jgi:hypothetical protein